MKNVKLILSSLFSNNSAIEGARKRRWYFAVIIFIFSLIISVVPTLVKYGKTKGDEVFRSYSYLTEEALQDYSRNVLDNGGSITLVYDSDLDINELKAVGVPEMYECKDHANNDKVYYRIFVTDFIDTEAYKSYKDASFIVFGKETFYFFIANPNNGNPINEAHCLKAWKKFNSDFSLKDVVSSMDDFKSFIRKAYNYDRVSNLWIQTGILAGINLVVSVIMGFLVWVLTRGKNNVYRGFSFWDCEKIVSWASISPAILGLIFGFLIKSFQPVSYALFIGVRIMWLTSKSLRPDGSGYAAN